MIDIGARKIIEELNKLGYEAYVVGGAVRDFLMGRKINDYDIATNAYPEQVKKLPFIVIPTGIKHGTMTVVIDSVSYEVTTYRTETNYFDHRHPKNVAFSCSLGEDLKRRDFTINAMAYDIVKSNVIDPFGGLEDLNNKIIKTVGNPYERFEEDALRILRALRFSSTLNFIIEDRTKEAIKNKFTELSYVSKERINSEISKLLVGINASNIIKEYIEIFKYIFDIISEDELIDCANCFNNSSNDLIVRLAILFKNVVEPKQAIKELKYPNITAIIVSNFVECYKKSITSNKNVFDVISIIRLENMNLYLDFLSSLNYEQSKMLMIKEFYNQIINNSLPMRINELKINGDDLLNIGIEGKKIKEVLNYLHELVLYNGLENDYEVLLHMAKYYLQK